MKITRYLTAQLTSIDVELRTGAFKLEGDNVLGRCVVNLSNEELRDLGTRLALGPVRVPVEVTLELP